MSEFLLFLGIGVLIFDPWPGVALIALAVAAYWVETREE